MCFEGKRCMYNSDFKSVQSNPLSFLIPRCCYMKIPLTWMENRPWMIGSIAMAAYNSSLQLSFFQQVQFSDPGRVQRLVLFILVWLVDMESAGLGCPYLCRIGGFVSRFRFVHTCFLSQPCFCLTLLWWFEVGADYSIKPNTHQKLTENGTWKGSNLSFLTKAHL